MTNRRRARSHVLASWFTYRIGVDGYGNVFVEKSDGKDKLDVTRWRAIEEREWAAEGQSIIRNVGLALERRRKKLQSQRDARRKR